MAYLEESSFMVDAPYTLSCAQDAVMVPLPSGDATFGSYDNSSSYSNHRRLSDSSNYYRFIRTFKVYSPMVSFPHFWGDMSNP